MESKKCGFKLSSGGRCKRPRSGRSGLCWQHSTKFDAPARQKGGYSKGDEDVTDFDVDVFLIFFQAHNQKISETSRRGKELNGLLQRYRNYLMTDDRKEKEFVEEWIKSQGTRINLSPESKTVQVGAGRKKGRRQRGGVSPTSEREALFKMEERRYSKGPASERFIRPPSEEEKQRQLLLGEQIRKRVADKRYSEGDVNSIAARVAELTEERIMKSIGPVLARLEKGQEASEVLEGLTHVQVKKGNEKLDVIHKDIKQIQAGTPKKSNILIRIMTGAFKWLCVQPIKTSYKIIMAIIVRPFIIYPVKLIVKVSTRYAALIVGVVIIATVANRLLYWYAHLSDNQQITEEYCYAYCPAPSSTFAYPQCPVDIYGPKGYEESILCSSYTRDGYADLIGYLDPPKQWLFTQKDVISDIVFKDWAGFRLYLGEIVDVLSENTMIMYNAISDWLTTAIKTASMESISNFIGATKDKFWDWGTTGWKGIASLLSD